jgi:rSAM/selenodomain-associated transferase 1
MIRPQEEIHRMSDTPQNCILFFVKDPVKGAVKSRLAAELDETIAVELYGNFILDMLATLSKCEAQCLICVYPESTLEKVKKWLEPKYHYLPQEGKDLGERMKNGFIEAFIMKFEHVILIGSDIPDLPLSIVKEAFRMFETHDAVVGPAHDGGYYLIGFRNDTFVPEVFDTMQWGGKSVLRSTLNRLNKRKCRVRRLPAWHDVDTLADIILLLQRNKSTVGSCPKTISYLSSLSLRDKPAG